MAERRAGSSLASLDCLPNGTIGYNPSAAVARDPNKDIPPIISKPSLSLMGLWE